MKILTKIKELRLVGGRILKTGVSVFLTAFICLLLDWPAIFAVITAIVTVEPTASDSIRKGFIRLPAAAIGAAFALTFTAFLGESAAAYALAATFTIFILHKLHLDAGILVATLTAVAMIPGTADNFLSAFFVRLGTTTTGITVSTLVNFLILPPKYYPMINRNINRTMTKASDVLDATIKHLVKPEKHPAPPSQMLYQSLRRDLERTYQLCDYQRAEWRYHKHTTKDMRTFHYAQKKLNLLQQIVFHISNLQYLQVPPDTFSLKEKQLLLKTASSIKEILRDSENRIPDLHYKDIEKLDDAFWHLKEDMSEEHPDRYRHHFSSQTIILFELLTMHDVLEDLQFISQRQKKLLRKAEY
ncbi:FUSC family protein [Bacillus marinisedimentorum]|uniref:FUSC family protein n=1 Tax=Bacillus marinisedimentorum TaxID=1821260 RepID=UPI0007E298BC|nr:aromatic acid exporter family protein [Bacillus marinisedimentorum]